MKNFPEKFFSYCKGYAAHFLRSKKGRLRLRAKCAAWNLQYKDKFPEKFVRIWKSDRIYIYNKNKMEKKNQLLFARFRDCLFPLAECFPRFMFSPLVRKIALAAICPTHLPHFQPKAANFPRMPPLFAARQKGALFAPAQMPLRRAGGFLNADLKLRKLAFYPSYTTRAA